LYTQELKKESDSGQDCLEVQVLPDDFIEKGFGTIDGFLNAEEINQHNL